MEPRKTTKADLDKKSFLFFTIGLMLSLTTVISAFEWKSYTDAIPITPEELDKSFIVVDVPLTAHPVPKPPSAMIDIEKDVRQEKEKVNEKIIIDDLVKVNIPAPNVDFGKLVDKLPDDEPVDEPPFERVENMPEPAGGMNEFLKFIGRNIKYPVRARRMGIEGTVYVQFVIDKDGSLTDIKVLKGIDPACDAAAIVAIQKSEKWKPGKQRGVPVRVRMIIPVKFSLGK